MGDLERRNCLSLPRILPIPIHSTQMFIYALFTRYLRITNTNFIFIFSSILFLTSFYISKFLFTVSKKEKKVSKTRVELRFVRRQPELTVRNWKSCVSVKTVWDDHHIAVQGIRKHAFTFQKILLTFWGKKSTVFLCFQDLFCIFTHSICLRQTCKFISIKK